MLLEKNGYASHRRTLIDDAKFERQMHDVAAVEATTTNVARRSIAEDAEENGAQGRVVGNDNEALDSLFDSDAPTVAREPHTGAPIKLATLMLTVCNDDLAAGLASALKRFQVRKNIKINVE